MTPTQGSCICPICLNPFLALSHHLKKSHYIANIDERKILLNLATGRVNIRRAKCPVLGCTYQSSRLDKHLIDGHPELNSEELAIESDAVKKAVGLQQLSDLRASHPRVSMTSMLDIVDDEDEQQGVDYLEEEVCQNQQCIQDRKSLVKLQRSIARKDREYARTLKKSQILAKKLRRCQQVIQEMKKGNATSWGEVEKEMDVDAEVEADQAEVNQVDQAEVDEVDQAEVDQVDQAEEVNEAEKQVEEVAMPSGQSSATTKDGQQEMERERKTVFKGTGRGARMRHLSLPKNIESFLEEYQLFHESSEPNIKQENAMSKTSTVRSFLFYLSVGRKDLSNWLFLDNTHGIRSYVTHLRQEGKEVTTVNFYLRNVYQFLTFLQQTPPKLCRLGRTQMTGLIRTVQNIIKNLEKPIVSHQLWVKATKMNKILSRVSLGLCQQRARKVIPKLLVQMEAGDYNLRDDFYGYFSAFVASIYGHRPGVLTNMKVGEVEAAKAEKLLDTDEGYVITVDEHKTNRFFGGAQIFLTFDEFLWLERWMAIRARMGPKTQYVLITKGDGPVKNLVRYMQTAWAQMGLPGRPTFTNIRTAVSGHAKNFHHPEIRKKLATFMCHNTSTADRFYALVLDRSQAKELRGQFEAVTASSSSQAAGPAPTSAASTSTAHRKSKKVVANSDDSEDSTAISYQERGSSILEEEEVMEEGSGMALVLSHSQLLSPEPMEEEEEEDEEGRDDSVIVVSDGSQPVSTNGHEPRPQAKKVHAAPDRLSQPERAGPEPEGLKDKSLSDSSGDISFHFTLPKEGELIGPVVGATPPLISQLKQTMRHSTPIEISSFSEKSGVAGAGSMAAGDAASGESGDEAPDGKLSLRMKLVTPVGEGSSERFSLQKPTLSEEEGSVAKVTAVAKAVTSPSVFTRVRQVHRQQEAREELQAGGHATPVRGQPPAPPQRSSPASSLGCNSLPNSQSEPSQQEGTRKAPAGPAGPPKDRQAPPPDPEPPSPNRTEARQSPSNKLRQRTVSQQTSFDAPGLRSPAGRGEPESPSYRRAAGPAHRRHVRTIQEVRTTVTRIITDVYYEDGKEVERKVTEESEEPVVDCHVLDGDISPCRTGNSSVTSGDLADISSLSSKASSLQHSSGGTSSSGFTRPDFIMPPIRGAFRGVGSLRRLGAQGPPPSSSEDEPFTRMLPPRLPASPADGEPAGRSDSLRSSPEEADAHSAGSSFVGLRVVAKWSSNGYFYSGRIIKDAGEGRFRLRFDDGYECEVAGGDILLCDPIPMETEVTALLEDEYFSIGVVRGHKTEGQDLLYSVEKEGQRQWYSRTAIILSLEQGNRLREQHSLGPYEPSTPLAKASDISLDNLVEGKRRRRGALEGPTTPDRSPRTPGPSSKRKLMASEDTRTPAKRGRRGSGARAAAQRVGLCNTSGSGTDLPAGSAAVAETHGPLPQNTTLFMGFAFMLTASSEIDRLTNRTASDDEDEYVQTGPYNKVYTESQLQAGGGFVLQDFNEEQCKAAYQSLLIADQHCRTRKYLLCLASGVPSVSHIWVRDCCKENKLLNYRNYLLPAGVGPDEAIVEWHPRCSPFKALRVLLVFEKPVELWAQLITMGGGSSVRQFPTDKDASDVAAGKYDVVVTDRTCPVAVQRAVASLDVPMVSPEWLIQSLIRGERLGFHGKPQYRHDYSSSSSSSS